MVPYRVARKAGPNEEGFLLLKVFSMRIPEDDRFQLRAKHLRTESLLLAEPLESTAYEAETDGVACRDCTFSKKGQHLFGI